MIRQLEKLSAVFGLSIPFAAVPIFSNAGKNKKNKLGIF
jgi:hypothetical protein